jgi:hypothetical protein
MLAVPLLRATLLPGSSPLEAALRRPGALLLPGDGLLPRTLRSLLLPGLLGSLCLLLRLLNPLLLRLLGPLLLLRLLGLLLPLLRLLGLLPLLRLLGPLLLLRLLSPLLLRLLLLGLLGALSLLLLLLLLLRLLSPLLLLRLLGLSLSALFLRGGCSLLSLTLLRFRFSLLILLLVLLRVRWNNRPEKQTQGSGTSNANELHCNLPPLNLLLGVHADDQSALTMRQRFRCLRLGLGLVHGPIRVVGGRVERIQLEWRRLRSVDHVMEGARRNHDRLPVSHLVLLLLVDDEFRLPLLDAEELVDVRVHFVPDVFSRFEAHHHKLGVLASV